MSANTNIGSTPVNQGYVQLIHTGETGGIDGTLRTLYDGDGTASDLQIASNAVKVSTTLYIGSDTLQEYIQDTVGAMLVTNASHTNLTASYDDVGDGAIDLNAIGSVNLTGTINANEFPQFHDSDTLKALTATEMRSALNVDLSGTDNSTNVTLVTTSHDYLSISGQAITLGTIDISDDTNLSGGAGITLTGDSLSVSASQTSITSIYNSALQIGSAADEQRIDFGTTDEIRLGSSTQTSVKIKTDPLGSAQDEVIIGDGTADVDFVVDNTSGTAIFKVDAGTGNTSITGDLNISGSFNPSTVTTTSVIATNYKHTTSPNNNAFTVGSTSGVEFVTNVDITGGNLTLEKGNGALLQLTTSESDVQVNDALGSINFFASNETGLAAGQLAASILAEARGQFDNSNNPTDLIFKLGTTGTATEQFRIYSSGGIKIGNAYTLPPSDGSANQILKTNGSGTLSFADESAGISFNGSTANGLLTYGGSTTADVESNLTFDASSNLDLLSDSGKLRIGVGNDLQIYHDGTDDIINTTGNAFKLLDSGSERFTINSAGNIQFNNAQADVNTRFGTTGSTFTLWIDGGTDRVGIGTNSPDYELDVAGDIGVDHVIYHNGDGNTYHQFTTDRQRFVVGSELLLDLYEDGTQDYVKLGDGGDVDINLNDDMFVEGSSGNVGIGTALPSFKLDVNGGIRNYANGSAVFRTESTAAGYGAYNKLITTTNTYDVYALNGDFKIDENGVATRFIIKDSTGHIQLPNDLQAIEFGAGQDGRIYSYNDDLYIVNQTAGQDTIFRNLNSAGTTYFDNLFIDGSAQKVGIGTTSPQRKLHVSTGDTSIAARFENTTSNGSVAEFISSGDSRTLTIQTDHIYSNGALYFGLGNYANTYRADSHTFQTTTSNTGRMTIENDGDIRLKTPDDKRVYFGVNNSASFRASSAGYNLFDSSDGHFYIRNTINGSNIYFGVNDGSTQYPVAITSTQRVGIGTASPSYLLHLSGTAPELAFTDTDGTKTWRARAVTNNFHITETGAGDPFVIESGAGANAFKINSSGNVGIGTASPSSKLHVKNASDISMDAQGNGQVRVEGNGYALGIALNASGAFIYQNSSARFMAFGNNETEQVRLTTGGALHVVNDVVAFSTTPSDIKLKTNVKDLNYGLDTIMKLNPKQYDWKEDNRHDIGFIAQEVEEVIPEIVKDNEWFDDKIKTMDYEKLTAVLIKAVQEQQKQIEELKNG